jgi:hypothetical protein
MKLKSQGTQKNLNGFLNPNPLNIQMSTSNNFEAKPNLKYHGVSLPSHEYQALIAIERTFGRVIPRLTHANIQSAFGYILEDNHITELKLTQFSLEGLIKITNLPEEFCDLTELKVLDMQLTEVRSLPKAFGKLNQLEIINLRCNRIEFLPESFGQLSYLRQLDLSHNYLKDLPILFQDLEQLQYLDLSSNQLQRLPESFGSCQSLEYVDLNKNHLQSLPITFGSLSHLRQLDLSHNLIDSFPSTTSKLISLEILDLRQNKITPEFFSVTKFPRSLRMIYISENSVTAPELFSQYGTDVPFWIFFQLPKINPQLEHVYFCPEHGKILRIQRIPCNKVKGWIDFELFCPVKGCAYREAVIPRNQELIQIQPNRSKPTELQSLPIIDSLSCPPHELQYIELGDRYIERCVRCGRSREEIDLT